MLSGSPCDLTAEGIVAVFCFFYHNAIMTMHTGMNSLLLQFSVLGTLCSPKESPGRANIAARTGHLLRLWRHKHSESQFKDLWCAWFYWFENRWFHLRYLHSSSPTNILSVQCKERLWVKKEKNTLSSTCSNPNLQNKKNELLEVVKLAIELWEELIRHLLFLYLFLSCCH